MTRGTPPALGDELESVTAALPTGAEKRPGQLAMAQAVEHAIEEKRHLVIQAGTGTGKSLAYLLPVVRSQRKVVVATATKALQDQLATKDLPFLSGALRGRKFGYAVLKGRSNYLCRQRAAEVAGEASVTAPLPGVVEGAPEGSPESFADQVRAMLAWGRTSEHGDRAELDFEPNPRAWAMLSVGARECPGAFRCPSGDSCFAEAARRRAADADVVVVNLHLYAAHVASGGVVLPEHEVLVFDEAHEAEDVMTAGLGIELTSGRLRALAGAARAALAGSGPQSSSRGGASGDGAKEDAAAAIFDTADRLDEVLRPLAGLRLKLGSGRPRASAGDPRDLPTLGKAPDGLSRSLTGPAGSHSEPSSSAASVGAPEDDLEQLTQVLSLARSRIEALSAALLGARDDHEGEARRTRALLMSGHLAEDLERLAEVRDDEVAWVEAGASEGTDGAGRSPARALKLAPIEVGPLLAERLWPQLTAVLTSATIPPAIQQRLGLPPRETDHSDVGSPFPYRENAMLYVARSLPDRRDRGSDEAAHREMRLLIEAAGGRTLALFTSWRAMHDAFEALGPLLPFRLLAQHQMPKGRLIEEFSSDEKTCLFATMSFWQGVDVPGRTLSLVIIDRLPFGRPDDPLLAARRERAGPRAFTEVDLPRAATMLAQGVGRLVRSSQDRGVVAVLDRRLATATYRTTLLQAVPPMRRSVERVDAVGLLRALSLRDVQ